MPLFSLHNSDCLAHLRTLEDCSIDSIVTDPPYGIGFMGKKWDYDVPSVDIWKECLRVLKPGGHLLAFAGTRTQHRMAVAIEDAGFEIRDMIAWVYGSGFPKSMDVSKAIDKHGGSSVAWFGPWFRKWRTERGITQKQVAALFPSKTGGLTGCVRNWELGFNLPTPEQFNLIRDTFGLPFESVNAAEREVVGFQARGTSVNTSFMSGGNDITAPATPKAQQWEGWGTALKPATEIVTMARKPFKGTVAANVLEHGTGALNIDGCRVSAGDLPSACKGTGWATQDRKNAEQGFRPTAYDEGQDGVDYEPSKLGRWPANLIHDGSDEVVGLFPDSKSCSTPSAAQPKGSIFGGARSQGAIYPGETGSAARFFYSPKVSKKERGEGNNHPTVKPIALMAYLCRLVTPPSGIVLDPFMGSGSTGIAALREGFGFIGIERESEYVKIAESRVKKMLEES